MAATNRNPKILPRDGPRNKLPKKLNAALITGVCTVLSTAIIAGLAMWTGRQQQVSSSIQNEAMVARSKLLQHRQVYLEKLNRTDFNPDELGAYASDGQPVLVGWRQMAAAMWSQQITTELVSQQADDSSPLFRLHMIPSLAIVKQDTMDILVEASAGNRSFYIGYTRTDGTSVKQELPRGGMAMLMLGKLEALDLAENLKQQPTVDLAAIVSQINSASEPYKLAQADYLRSRNLLDPVEQLVKVPKIREGIAQNLAKRRAALENLKAKPTPNLTNGGGGGK